MHRQKPEMQRVLFTGHLPFERNGDLNKIMANKKPTKQDRKKRLLAIIAIVVVAAMLLSSLIATLLTSL